MQRGYSLLACHTVSKSGQTMTPLRVDDLSQMDERYILNLLYFEDVASVVNAIFVGQTLRVLRVARTSAHLEDEDGSATNKRRRHALDRRKRR